MVWVGTRGDAESWLDAGAASLQVHNAVLDIVGNLDASAERLVNSEWLGSAAQAFLAAWKLQRGQLQLLSQLIASAGNSMTVYGTNIEEVNAVVAGARHAALGHGLLVDSQDHLFLPAEVSNLEPTRQSQLRECLIDAHRTIHRADVSLAASDEELRRELLAVVDGLREFVAPGLVESFVEGLADEIRKPVNALVNGADQLREGLERRARRAGRAMHSVVDRERKAAGSLLRKAGEDARFAKRALRFVPGVGYVVIGGEIVADKLGGASWHKAFESHEGELYGQAASDLTELGVGLGVAGAVIAAPAEVAVAIGAGVTVLAVGVGAGVSYVWDHRHGLERKLKRLESWL